jgi:cytochrome c oxidase subunit III
MSTEAHAEHHDTFGAKLGMWLFLVTEINLFGGLFIAYSYMRHKYPAEFHHAGSELNAVLGVTNTIVLLTSSLTVVLAIMALQQGKKSLSLVFLWTTVGFGLVFQVIKSFEWSAKFHHGLYPGGEHLAAQPHGEQVFFGLYFTMTGLHGVHVLVGITVLSVVALMIAKGKITQERNVTLENAGLYWHLVDIIWIFLLPLFYLAA